MPYLFVKKLLKINCKIKKMFIQIKRSRLFIRQRFDDRPQMDQHCRRRRSMPVPTTTRRQQFARCRHFLVRRRRMIWDRSATVRRVVRCAVAVVELVVAIIVKDSWFLNIKYRLPQPQLHHCGLFRQKQVVHVKMMQQRDFPVEIFRQS